MPLHNFESVLELLRIVGEHNFCDAVWWRCDGIYAPVTFLVNCNDFFYPAADCEEVTEENIPVLRQAFEDCAALDKANPTPHEYAVFRAELLFVARVRGIRPRDDRYARLPATLKLLFDEAVA